jgi:hypothetical protein
MFFSTDPNNWLRRPQKVLQRTFLLSLILGAAVVISSGSGTADDWRPSGQAATSAPADRADGDAPLSGALSGSSAPAISADTVEALPQSHAPDLAAADRHRRLLLVLILRSGSWHISPFPR